jgi:hypothetical protein
LCFIAGILLFMTWSDQIFRFRTSLEIWSRWYIDNPDWWRPYFSEMWLEHKYSHSGCHWWNFKFLLLDLKYCQNFASGSIQIILFGSANFIKFIQVFCQWWSRLIWHPNSNTRSGFPWKICIWRHFNHLIWWESKNRHFINILPFMPFMA